jgi:sugar lactone lactonase YvrE
LSFVARPVRATRPGGLATRSFGRRSRRTPGQSLNIPADGKEVRRVEETLVDPDGIIGSPDGKTLYVADIGDRKTYAYAIQPDGSLADRKLFRE